MWSFLCCSHHHHCIALNWNDLPSRVIYPSASKAGCRGVRFSHWTFFAARIFGQSYFHGIPNDEEDGVAGAKGGDIGSNFVHAIFADRVIPTLFAPFAGGYSHSLRLFKTQSCETNYSIFMLMVVLKLLWEKSKTSQNFVSWLDKTIQFIVVSNGTVQSPSQSPWPGVFIGIRWGKKHA